MKCKFEHNGYCCNSGTFRFTDACDPENCDYCAPMSRGDILRTSDEALAKFLSGVVRFTDCPLEVWDSSRHGLRYEDAWLKWLEEPCE